MKDHVKYEISSKISDLSEKKSLSSLAHKTGVSTATLSQMKNGNWQSIKDSMWRKVQIGLKINLEWKTAVTANLKGITSLLEAVQSRSMAIAISFAAGVGKTHSYRYYERYHENVIHVECAHYWTKKTYVQNILMAAGQESYGTTEQLIERLIDHLKGLNKPLLILDQADKLKDPSFDIFMDLYNELDSYCGFVLSGVPALQKRLMKGWHKDKSGYAEIWSRIGRRTISLKETTILDVKAICVANNLTDEAKINEIYNISDGDLRRVKKSIEQYFLISQKQPSNAEGNNRRSTNE